MKKINILSIGCLICLTISCKKKEKDPTSVWTINGETFSTNDYIVDKGKAIANFTGKVSPSNAFGFTFQYGSFPTGSFQVDRNNPDPSFAHFGINYNKISYALPAKAIIRTIIEEAKPVYKIDSMWMFNETNANDSVLLKAAAFRLPVEN